MTQEELISKKELLQLTGISYGQLYRWKRQHLIPESWFMKQSAYTGQETFFPKYKILARISVILELKDQYTLEQMASLFSPEKTDRVYDRKEAFDILDISHTLQTTCREVWEKDELSFIELLFLHMGSTLEQEHEFSEAELNEWLKTAKDWMVQFNQRKMSIGDQSVVAVRKAGMTFFLLVDGPGKVWSDNNSKVICVFDLTERTKRLNMLLQHSLGGLS